MTNFLNRSFTISLTATTLLFTLACGDDEPAGKKDGTGGVSGTATGGTAGSATGGNSGSATGGKAGAATGGNAGSATGGAGGATGGAGGSPAGGGGMPPGGAGGAPAGAGGMAGMGGLTCGSPLPTGGMGGMAGAGGAAAGAGGASAGAGGAAAGAGGAGGAAAGAGGASAGAGGASAGAAGAAGAAGGGGAPGTLPRVIATFDTPGSLNMTGVGNWQVGGTPVPDSTVRRVSTEGVACLGALELYVPFTTYGTAGVNTDAQINFSPLQNWLGATKLHAKVKILNPGTGNLNHLNGIQLAVISESNYSNYDGAFHAITPFADFAWHPIEINLTVGAGAPPPNLAAIIQIQVQLQSATMAPAMGPAAPVPTTLLLDDVWIE